MEYVDVQEEKIGKEAFKEGDQKRSQKWFQATQGACKGGEEAKKNA